MTLSRKNACVATIAIVFACSEATEPDQLTPTLSLTRVADCSGPARSLDPELAASLPQHTGYVTPDERWADLAKRVPGGFAGIVYVDSKPVLLLTDPSQAAAAKEALAPEFPRFDIRGAEVRQARWDFAQLVEWQAYLMINGHVWQTPGMTTSDNDEAINRISYGVLDDASRARLASRLAGMNLPCDLIAIEITGPIGELDGQR
jgi:hypothetical protein